MKKISKNYGNQQALCNVTFSLEKGEIVGFLGPNGAGKSTLMKIICCYLLQDKGNVKVCNLDTKTKENLIKSKIGYLSENNPLYTDMYIKEYLYFIGSMYKITNLKKSVLEIIRTNRTSKRRT